MLNKNRIKTNFVQLLTLLLFLSCSSNLQKNSKENKGDILKSTTNVANKNLLLEAVATDKKMVSTLIIPKTKAFEDVVNFVSANGGIIEYSDKELNYISAILPPVSAMKLPKEGMIEEATYDKILEDFPAPNESDDVIMVDPAVPFRETKINELQKKYTGKGIKIAILDSGLSPEHPSLQKTLDGRNKVIDWIDMTGEGDVEVSEIKRVDSFLIHKENKINLGDYRSDDDLYYWGEFKESNLKYPDDENNLSDFNQDGDSADVFQLVLMNVNKTWKIFIDKNLNNSIADESGVRDFRESGEHFAMDTSNKVFVCFKLNDERGVLLKKQVTENKFINYVNIGFDGSGHGTHVAGILSGINLGKKEVNGAAPDSQLYIYKIVTGARKISLRALLKAFSDLKEKKIDVVNLSMGKKTQDAFGDETQSKIIDFLSEKYHIIFSTTAGNYGPGFRTISPPGSSYSSITTGAFLSKEAMISNEMEFMENPVGEIIWEQSSTGPRQDGAIKPDIVAPGTILSSIPFWKSSKNNSHFAFKTGTSMACPITSGLVALLIEAAKKEDIGYDSNKIKYIIKNSARKLEEYDYLQQGYGVINAANAYELLKMKFISPDIIDVKIRNNFLNHRYGSGFISETGRSLKKKIDFKLIKNESGNEKITYKISSNSKILADFPQEISLEKMIWKAVDVNIRQDLLVTGLNISILKIDNPLTGGVDLEIPITVVKPFRSGSKSFHQEINDEVGFGRIKRYFLYVEKELSLFSLKLKATNDKSKVKMVVFAPDQNKRIETSNISGEYTSEDLISSPAQGLWEIVVIGSPSVEKSKFMLAIANFSIKSNSKELLFKNEDLSNDLLKGSVNFQNLKNQITSKEDARIDYFETREKITIETQKTLQKKFQLEKNCTDIFVSITNGSNKKADVNIVIKSGDEHLATSKNKGINDTIKLEKFGFDEITLFLGRTETPSDYNDTTFDLIFKQKLETGVRLVKKTNENNFVFHETDSTWNYKFILDFKDAVKLPENFYYSGSIVSILETGNILHSIPVRIVPSITVEDGSEKSLDNSAPVLYNTDIVEDETKFQNDESTEIQKLNEIKNHEISSQD